MNINRRKELMEEYKNRMPEMGIIVYVCESTGDSFYSVSKDTRADFNSTTFKLKAGNHPNETLQKLWNEYGKQGFQLKVVEKIKYEDPSDDKLNKELEELLEKYLSNDEKGKKIWR